MPSLRPDALPLIIWASGILSAKSGKAARRDHCPFQGDGGEHPLGVECDFADIAAGRRQVADSGDDGGRFGAKLASTAELPTAKLARQLSADCPRSWPTVRLPRMATNVLSKLAVEPRLTMPKGYATNQ
jgi:hypothetical protein